MPIDINPYYWRGYVDVELNKYERAISDLSKVASDTTSALEILALRVEAFRLLHLFDTSIVLCNRLLALKADSLVVLSQRGLCYYGKGENEKACYDLKLSKQLDHNQKYHHFDELLKKCK